MTEQEFAEWTGLDVEDVHFGHAFTTYEQSDLGLVEGWEARAETGRALGGQHLPRVRRIVEHTGHPVPHENPPMRCNVCGSIELREVERTARSVETYGGESVSWWCADCGADQGQG